MIPGIFGMLSRFVVEILMLPVHLDCSPDILHLKGCWSQPSYRSDKMKSRQIFGIHPVYQETFLHIHKFLRQLYIFRNWTLLGRKLLKNRFTCLQRKKSERPERDPDLRCQSGPSAKNSVLFSGGDSSKNYGANQQRLQISDFHFDKFPTPATFAWWKIKFKTEVCTCSQFPTEAMQWIKEVELVDSVDELRSSSSTRGISMPNFEVFDARIASALKKIIHNSHFKKKISLEEQKAKKQDRIRRGRLIAYLVHDHFRVTGTMCLSKTTPTYSPLFFEMTIFRNSILSGTEFYWHDENPTWWHLGRIVQIKNARVWETQDRIGIVRPGDSSKEVRTWLSQIESCGEKKYRAGNSKQEFWARSGNFEKNAVVKNQGTKQRVQRILGDCWQWETNGQCVKGDNCSFRHDINKRGKNDTAEFFSSTLQHERKGVENPKSQSKKVTSEELATTHFVKDGILQNACSTKTRMVAVLGEKCSFAHRQVDAQPTKWSKSNNDKSAVAMLKKGNWQERESVTDECHGRPGKPGKRGVKKLGRNSSKRQLSDARQLGCAFQDMTPSKSILRKSTDMPKTIQRVKFKKATARHTKIRDENPSPGYICPGELHERSPNAPKFEDRSQEETEWQELGAREAAWKLAKHVFKLKEHERAAFILTSRK